MTQVWAYINGQRVEIPQADYEARECGWHKGAECNWRTFADDERNLAIRSWCRQTFDPHTYVMFSRGVYFLYESDAVMCKLRFA
jgi:hypothetical protein